MYYVLTDDDRVLCKHSNDVFYTPERLQEIANNYEVSVYVITGERTGQFANPQTEFDSLRIIHVDGSTIWATTEDSRNEFRSLYRCQVGQPFEPVGDNQAGIPADVPQRVRDAM